MTNNKDNMFIYVILALLIGTVIIAGCSSSGNNIPADTSNGNVAQQSPANAVDSGANGNSQDTGTNADTDSGYRQFNGNRSGRYGGGMNPTDEQRTQMMQEIIQAETDACNGMSEGDACSVSASSQYGPGGARNGTCTFQNSTLLCRTNFGAGRGSPGAMPDQPIN